MRSLPLPGRRLAVAVGALVAVGLAASAMTASASSQHSTASSTLVVDKSFDLKTSDPQRQFEPTGGIVDHALYDTLLTFIGADVSHPMPDIAVSFKASTDAKTYTFQLRKNIKFSDGTPLTSKDVVFSFRRLVNLKGNPSFLLAGITTSAKGPYTVVLKSKTPNPAIPVLVANTSLGIVNSKVVKAHGGSDAADADKTDKAESYLNAHSAGSGPYVLKSFSTTSQVVMTANPAYWGPKPKFPTVVLRNVSAAAQLLDVQRGTNEIAVDLSPDQAHVAQGQQQGPGRETPSANVFFLFANHNPRSRRPRPTRTSRTRSATGSTTAASCRSPARAPCRRPASSRRCSSARCRPRPGSSRTWPRPRPRSRHRASATRRSNLEYPSDITSNGLSFGVLAQRIAVRPRQGRHHGEADG